MTNGPPYRVLPRILAVPAGADANYYFFSLRVTPAAGGGSSAVDLAKWPEEVAKLAGMIRADIARITSLGAVAGQTRIGLYKADGALDQPYTGAETLWARSFDPPGLALLHTVLDNPSGAEKKSGDAPPLLLKPFIDKRFLGERILSSRVNEALAAAKRLKIGKRAVAGPAVLAPADGAAGDGPSEEEAWALPALDRDEDLSPRLAGLLGARDAAAALSKSKDDKPWRDLGSVALLEAAHAGALYAGDADPDLAALLKSQAPDTMPKKILAALEAMMASIPTTPQTEKPYVPEVGENERRKLAAILSQPLIAKYLGMQLDVRIPKGDWETARGLAGAGGRGAVAFSFVDAAPAAGTSWTAYLDAPAAGGVTRYFGPCDEQEALTGAVTKSQKFTRGMLNLGAKKADGTARYSLMTLDPMSASFRRMRYGADAEKAKRAGQAPPETPDFAGRGLALLDNDIARDNREAATREASLDIAKGTPLLFAGDLLVGYRPMVGVAKRKDATLAIAVDRWRSLVARQISYGSPIDPQFVRDHYRDEREHGHTRNFPVSQPTTGGAAIEPDHPELFVWTGESLATAVPTPKGNSRLEAKDGEELPVDLVVRLVKSADNLHAGLPPLREGRGYVVGMTAMFVNGVSISLAEAAALNAAQTDHLLGDGTRPYVQPRIERVPPPMLLLRDGTAFVTAKNLEAHRGESLTTLVFRAGKSRPQRYMVPERIAFDRAEQQNLFNAGSAQTPLGAFETLGVVRSPDSGAFPLAIEGAVVTTENPAGAARTRGPVLRFDQGADRPTEPYYPDRYSRGVRADFRAIIPSNAACGALAKAPLYRSGNNSFDIGPILFEVKEGTRSGLTISRVDTSDKVSPDHPGGRTLQKISVELAPAAIVEVDLYSEVDAAETTLRHFVGQGFGKSLKGSAAGELAAAITEARMAELQGTTKIRIVHAVERPLARPVAKTLAPILVTVGNGEAGSFRTWKKVVADNSPVGKPNPFASWSVEGGATCFFAGTTELDGPSTGTLSLDAIWQDWGPEMVRHTPGKHPPFSEERVDQFARLFTVDDVPDRLDRPAGKTLETLDLLGDLNAPRSLSYSFKDGRARRLRTFQAALSRFADYFPPSPAPEQRPGVAGDHETVSQPGELWIPCNFRPPPLTVERITPWFNYRYSGKVGEQVYRFSRTTSYRVELGREGFISGEGERVGVVFNRRDAAICDYASDVLKPFASGVTRWGRDPLHDSPVPQVNVAPSWFRGWDLEADCDLHAGADPLGGSAPAVAPLGVRVLGHAIELDREKGEFYCDLAIDEEAAQSSAYMPFIQLGLTRFQPHSVIGLELSTATGHQVQLLPRRSGEVRFKSKSEANTFTLTLRGPIDPDPNKKILLDLIALRLLDDERDGPRWVQQSHQPEGKLSQRLGVERTSADGWVIKDFSMARGRRFEHTGILIEEYELITDTMGGVHRRILSSFLIDFGRPPRTPGPGASLDKG